MNMTKVPTGADGRLLRWKSSRYFIPAIVLLAVVYTFALPYFLPLETPLDYSNSIWPLFVLGLFVMLFRTLFTEGMMRALKYAWPFGLMISTFLILGKDVAESRDVRFWDWKLWISISLLAALLSLITARVWLLLESRESKRLSGDKKKQNDIKRPRWYIVWPLIFIAWIPIWLCNFPGTFVGDEIFQLIEYETGAFTSAFPILHTLFIGGVVSGVQKLTGSYNAGIAVLTFIQMVILSGIFTYVLTFLRKTGVSRGLTCCAASLFALSPVIMLFSKDTVRDVMFSALLLLFGILLTELLLNSEEFLSCKLKAVFIILVGFAVTVMRNAAIILIVAMASAFFVRAVCKKSKILARACVIFGVIIAMHAVWSGPFYDMLGIEKAPTKEYLSVPISQISKTVSHAEVELTEEDLNNTLTLFSEPLILGYYDNDSVDLPKSWFDGERYSEDIPKYTKWWASLGTRYPGLYLNAFLSLNCDVWYPNTLIDDLCTPPRDVSDAPTSYYSFRVDLPGELNSQFPWLLEIQRKISEEISFQKIPLVSLLFSPAMMLYILMFAALYLLYCGKSVFATPLLIAIAVHFATFFGPMVVLRYNLLSFITVPFAFAAALSASCLKDKQAQKTGIS